MMSLKHNLLIFSVLLALLSCHKESAVPGPWQPVTVSNNSTTISLMEEVRFSSAQIGWISGGIDKELSGSPVLLKTTDGGSTWNSIDLSALHISRFIAFYPVTNQVLYACAPDRSLPPPNYSLAMYKSSDSGSTWSKLAGKNFTGSFDLHFFTEQTGLSANIDYIQKTTDGGTTWSTVYNEPLAGLDMLQCFPSGTAYVASSSKSILLKSTDSGTTWQKLSWAHASFVNFSFVSEQVGFAGTLDRELYKTVNGGASWQLVPGQLPLNISPGVFRSEQEGYLPGTALYHTTDGGRSWRAEHTLAATDRFTTVGFSSTGTGIAITNNGLIVRK